MSNQSQGQAKPETVETQIDSTRRLLRIARDERSYLTIDSTVSALLTICDRLVVVAEQQQQQIEDMEALIREVEIERPIAAVVSDGAVYSNWKV